MTSVEMVEMAFWAVTCHWNGEQRPRNHYEMHIKLQLGYGCICERESGESARKGFDLITYPFPAFNIILQARLMAGSRTKSKHAKY